MDLEVWSELGLLVAILGVASVVAWATTVVAVIQAFNGASWVSVIVWGVIAIAVTATRGAAQRAAVRHEMQASVQTLEAAAAASPALTEAIEYFGSGDYQRLGRTPPPHPTPVDVGGLVLMLLSWVFAIGGTVLSVIGSFQVLNDVWWVLVLGIVLLLLAGPLHRLQKSRYASRVLAVYEHEMVGPLPKTPSQELRLALWQFAQAAAPGGASTDTRVAQMVDVYTEMVAAWGEDQ
ncbi:hypothetical protein DEU34_0656 [Microbacterium sp. AG1240]|nr:hypothetical protein DEU34_0656 [Microbacterium sp. AG1240]